MKHTQKRVLLGIILIFGLLGFISTPGYSQTTEEYLKKMPKPAENEVIYDWINGVYKPVDFMAKYGKGVKFTVLNVNPFLYKASIASSFYDYFTDVPKAFSFLLSDKEETDAAAKAGEAITESMKGESRKNDTDNELAQKVKNTVNSFINAYVKLDDMITFHDRLLSLVERNHSTYEELEKTLENKSSVLGIEFTATRDIKDSEKQETVHKKNTENFNKKIGEFRKAMKEAVEAYWACERVWTEAKQANLENLDSIFQKVNQFKKNLDEIQKAKVIESIDRIVFTIDKEKFKVSHTVPSARSDEIRFDVTLTPRTSGQPAPGSESAESSESSGANITFQVPVPVKYGLAINFSTGFLGNYNWKNHDFYLKDVENDSTKATIAKGENVKRFKFGPAAFMHMYIRNLFSRDFNIAATLGLGTEETENINYCFGLSALFGREQRVVFTVGITLANVNDLKSPYNEGQELTKGENVVIENFVEKDRRVRAFFGVSFNLFQKKVTKLAKQK